MFESWIQFKVIPNIYFGSQLIIIEILYLNTEYLHILQTRNRIHYYEWVYKII
jgi:hypothetical protein